MKVLIAIFLTGAAISFAGCASKSHPGKPAAKTQTGRPVTHFSDPEKQRTILEEKIKVKFLALESLAKDKPQLSRQLNEVIGYLPAVTLQLKADAARAAVQKDQAYLDALKSFYLALSNRQQAIAAELKIYEFALAHPVAAAVTNVVSKK